MCGKHQGKQLNKPSYKQTKHLFFYKRFILSNMIDYGFPNQSILIYEVMRSYLFFSCFASFAIFSLFDRI